MHFTSYVIAVQWSATAADSAVQIEADSDTGQDWNSKTDEALANSSKPHRFLHRMPSHCADRRQRLTNKQVTDLMR